MHITMWRALHTDVTAAPTKHRRDWTQFVTIPTTITAKIITYKSYCLKCAEVARNEQESNSLKSAVQTLFDSDINCCHLFSMVLNKWERLTAIRIFIINKLMLKQRFQNWLKNHNKFTSDKESRKRNLKINEINFLLFVGKINTIDEIRKRKIVDAWWIGLWSFICQQSIYSRIEKMALSNPLQ